MAIGIYNTGQLFLEEYYTLTINAPANTAPVINVPADITIEASGPQGGVATFEVTATDREDGTLPVNLSQPSGSTFPVGTTTVTATATDSAGATANGTFNVTVRDTMAPVFQSLTASPSTITKANNKMVAVVLTAQVKDAVDSALDTRIVSVTGNQNVTGDYEITGPLTLNVRAKNTGKASRVYSITVESRDDFGNVASQTVTVTVR